MVVWHHSVSQRHSPLHFTLHWMIVMLNTFCNRIASWTVESFKFMSVWCLRVYVYFSIFIWNIWTLCDQWQKRGFSMQHTENNADFVNRNKLRAQSADCIYTYDTFISSAIISIFAIFGASPLSNWFWCVLMLFGQPVITLHTTFKKIVCHF